MRQLPKNHNPIINLLGILFILMNANGTTISQGFGITFFDKYVNKYFLKKRLFSSIIN